MSRPTQPLTENQRELLRQFDVTFQTWWRPMDLGGRDGTSHSAVLAQLERRGFVESRQRNGALNAARGSKLYRITDAGREARGK